jgi:four helix bundle protein
LLFPFAGSNLLAAKTGVSRMKPHAFDLQPRLVAFSVAVIQLTGALPATVVGNHVRGQLLRSGTSPAPNYGEAQGAESRNDFAHKLKIVLKELRETQVWLQVIEQAGLCESPETLLPLLRETNELIAIFVASLKTTLGRQG